MRFCCTLLLAALAWSSTGCYRVVAGYGWKPRWDLPVAGPGALTNIGSGAEANGNALAHVTTGAAITLFGEHVGGSCGLWAAGLGWMGYGLLEEAGWHAPDRPGAGYASEVRADLLTKLGPALILLASDLIRHGWPSCGPSPAKAN